MQFLQRKRRQPPAIIIVALIDILIVLVIFLMVTTTFKQQPALKLALPESTQARKSGAQEKPPLVVVIERSGVLRFGPEGIPVTVDGLKDHLKAAAAKEPEIKLAISGDKSAPWGKIIQVMDAARESGVKAVSAFTKEAAKE